MPHSVPPTPLDQLVTTSTFARIADRSESTVRDWDRRGIVTAVVRTPNGLRLYDREDAERLRNRPRRQRR
jgi:DNA-binding transcriptional MerR regulator